MSYSFDLGGVFGLRGMSVTLCQSDALTDIINFYIHLEFFLIIG